jgi:hypothetical protein
MKPINSKGLMACLLITSLYFTACAQTNSSTENAKLKSTGKGFVVLELFTSEGCSSCPPADKVLAQIQQESKGKPVYLLAYHVDYWNRLGWKDVFSKAEFSQRQALYGNWLKAQIYTPQLVINGKTELVGSDGSVVRDIIANELAGSRTNPLLLHVRQDSDHLNVHFKTGHASGNSRILIALIQKEAQTKVARGENAGHTLPHVQIVRQLQSEYLKGTGEGNTTIDLPKDFDAQSWEILAMIQDQNSGEITDAAKADIDDTVTTKNTPEH